MYIRILTVKSSTCRCDGGMVCVLDVRSRTSWKKSSSCGRFNVSMVDLPGRVLLLKNNVRGGEEDDTDDDD